MRPSFTLLEVVVGLALLATLGVWLLTLQASAVRQYRQAGQLAEVVDAVDLLLWEWSVSQAPITLPADGRLTEHHTWHRRVQPLRITGSVLVTHVSVVVRATDQADSSDVYRVDWLVPPAPPRGSRP